MALLLADRVQELTTAGFAGTGAVQLNGVPTDPAGRVSFSAGIGTGNETVFLVDDNAGNWEISTGTLTTGAPDSLTRDTVLASSAGGAKVNFTSGVKDVKVVLSAARLVTLDNHGDLTDGNGNGLVATQAEQEAGTATDRIVTSARQHLHPSAAKFWGHWQDNGSIVASYNISSITDHGTGQHTVNYSTNFSSGGTSIVALGANLSFISQDGGEAGAGSVQLWCSDPYAGSHTPKDPVRWYAAGFGDQ